LLSPKKIKAKNIQVKFESKADTLKLLEDKLGTAKVLPQFSFSYNAWEDASSDIEAIGTVPDWMDFSEPLIVRSSGQSEDSLEHSLAGHFESVLGVSKKCELIDAVNTVFKSFGSPKPDDQVFIQPMLKDVLRSGVAFTRDPSNGGHYHVINYDDQSGSTSSVTDGSSGQLKTIYHFKSRKIEDGTWMNRVIDLSQELQALFDHDSLDLEFGFDSKDELFLLQVRPLILNDLSSSVSISRQEQVLAQIEEKVNSLSKPHPYLLGKRSVFGVMPDWNPAEIIGIRPKPLALSLYKELITDSIWAYQRDNYGYRNLRSFPLLVSFSGVPFIDVRVSFNSFIPSSLNDEVAEKLVDSYVENLVENPNKHDKVEFEIVHSCYTLDLPARLEEQKAQGFTEAECSDIAESLRVLTNNIINDQNGLWKKDYERIEELRARHTLIQESNLTKIEKIYWLIEDCKRYGTLPFAGLARAGFIAVQMIGSLVRTGILSEVQYHGFMSSLNTVSSRMASDLSQNDFDSFLQTYGHLRPGTYDILSPRYDETPELYFSVDSDSGTADSPKESAFSLGLDDMNRLSEILMEHKLDHNVISLLNFFRSAIEGREYAKYIFTRSLSDVLKLISELGSDMSISKEELSYLNINDLRKLYASSENPENSLKRSIEHGKQDHEDTCSLNLPSLITSSSSVWSYEPAINEPNFITLKSIRGSVVLKDEDISRFSGNILMVESADPGYDWIFSHGIGGFITKYGGANSHMAIRAGELGIPAVIGAGEALYGQWEKGEVLELDCMNKKVLVIK
jgi:phosphohistidine swiveling domain-containing protein